MKVMSRGPHIGAAQTSAILAWLRQRENEMADLLAEPVALPTENTTGKNYRACTELLEIRMSEFGLDCERLAPGDSKPQPDGAPVRLQGGYGGGERAIYFHEEYDVGSLHTPR